MIFNKNALDKVVNRIKKYGKQTLVLVCIREFNQLLKSWYEMRKGESEEYANVTFDEFKHMKFAKIHVCQKILRLCPNTNRSIPVLKNPPFQHW